MLGSVSAGGNVPWGSGEHREPRDSYWISVQKERKKV